MSARAAALLPPQVVEGREGGKLPGFEAYFKSTVHASPLLYDVDFDGIQDILVATYDGEILFFKDTVSGTEEQNGWGLEGGKGAVGWWRADWVVVVCVCVLCRLWGDAYG